jgi:hypothetical protein
MLIKRKETEYVKGNMLTPRLCQTLSDAGEYMHMLKQRTITHNCISTESIFHEQMKNRFDKS